MRREEYSEKPELLKAEIQSGARRERLPQSPDAPARNTSCKKIEPQETQYLPDDFSGSLSVVQQVKCVRSLRVVHQCEGQIAGQRPGDEAVEHFVQVRELVLARSGKKQGNIPPQVRDRFPGRRVGESKFGCRFSRAACSRDIQSVAITQNHTLQILTAALHQQ